MEKGTKGRRTSVSPEQIQSFRSKYCEVLKREQCCLDVGVIDFYINLNRNDIDRAVEEYVGDYVKDYAEDAREMDEESSSGSGSGSGSCISSRSNDEVEVVAPEPPPAGSQRDVIDTMVEQCNDVQLNRHIARWCIEKSVRRSAGVYPPGSAAVASAEFIRHKDHYVNRFKNKLYKDNQLVKEEDEAVKTYGYAQGYKPTATTKELGARKKSALNDSSNRSHGRNSNHHSKRKISRPTSSGSGVIPSGPSRRKSCERDGRLASNPSSCCPGGVIGPGTKPNRGTGSRTVTFKRTPVRSTGAAASSSGASSTTLSVFDGKYTASVSSAMQNRLTRNQTTLACGATIGLGREQVRDIATSFFASKNKILLYAEKSEHVASYLRVFIPNKKPAQSANKANLAKLAVEIWGGLRLIDWDQAPLESRPRRSSSTIRTDHELQQSIQLMQETECSILAANDEQMLSKATGQGVKLTPAQRQRGFLKGGGTRPPPTMRSCPRCGNDKLDLPPENAQARKENAVIMEEWNDLRDQAQAFLDGETDEAPLDGRGRQILDPKQIANPKLKKEILVVSSTLLDHLADKLADKLIALVCAVPRPTIRSLSQARHECVWNLLRGIVPIVLQRLRFRL